MGMPPPEDKQGGAEDPPDHQHGADRDHERARPPLRSQSSLDLLTLAPSLVLSLCFRQAPALIRPPWGVVGQPHSSITVAEAYRQLRTG